MKKFMLVLMLVISIFLTTGSVIAKPDKPEKCTTIQSGELETYDGEVITVGYDEWGYNYQAHLFNGMYCDFYHDMDWCQEDADVKLSKKWNDAWLSNQDCDNDGELDWHYGYESYYGSGAWVTNHMSGEYEGEDGKTCKWTYFTKIVAVPKDAYKLYGTWYTADGVEIGPVDRGAFAMIQSIYNDPCDGYGGVEYLSPSGPGLGNWQQLSEPLFNQRGC